jgi:hypothetical protein
VTGYRTLLCALLAAVLAGCNTLPSEQHTDAKTRPFRLSQLGKSDMDQILEIQIDSSMEYLKLLMEKLYRRNPREWRKAGQPNLESAVARVFGPRRAARFPELGAHRSVESMRLAFEDDYPGDRVLALIEGMRGMLLDAFNGKRELFLPDELDPQKIYYSARNIEIVAWKLNHNRNRAGRLFLLSNELEGEVLNLSFERLFGKLIALQDSSARIVAESSNRRIKNVIQSVAEMIFFPI